MEVKDLSAGYKIVTDLEEGTNYYRLTIRCEDETVAVLIKNAAWHKWTFVVVEDIAEVNVIYNFLKSLKVKFKKI